MAKIVEFIGPPASGKSTVYRHLRKLWKKDDLWKPFQKIDFNGDCKKQKIKKLINKFLRREKKIREQELESGKQKFINKNPDFMDFLWEVISVRPREINGLDLRFQLFNYFLKQCVKHEKISKNTFPGYCVIEEGLVHNIGIVKTSKKNYEELLKDLIKMLNFPEVIFYFRITPEELLKRKLMRERILSSEKDLTKEQLFLNCIKAVKNKEKKVKVLKNLPIQVYTIDALKSPEEN